MKAMIRAKFRLLKTTEHWDGHYDLDLGAVTAGKSDDPDTSEENLAFWDATPSAEMSLGLRLTPPWPPGTYLYLDFDNPDGPIGEGLGLWEVESVRELGSCIEYTFRLRSKYRFGDDPDGPPLDAPWYDRHDVGDTPAAAMGLFSGHIKMTINGSDRKFGSVGQLWDMRIRPAE